MLKVVKFGGSSVADKNRLFNVASLITGEFDRGNSLVVVVSAQGDSTDILIQKAEALAPNPNKRELDMLVSTGEVQSASLLSIVLNAMGYSAVSLNGVQAGIMASGVYGDAKVTGIETSRIRDELAKGKIVIVTGFQGYNDKGDVITLGRGGSDTSAVALAHYLKADLCEIYTDVAGVYTADPRVVKSAKKLDLLSYENMLELANNGARVLHNRCVEFARAHNVELVVRSSFSKEAGTKVSNTHIEGLSGIAINGNIVTLVGEINSEILNKIELTPESITEITAKYISDSPEEFANTIHDLFFIAI